jgi:dipeptidyl aminopeptidase/acylaminoacyl peptidase
MLLVTGTADTTVAPHNSDDMAAKLKSFGSAVRVIRYPGIGHTGVILSLVPGFGGITRLRQDMLDFIHGQ